MKLLHFTIYSAVDFKNSLSKAVVHFTILIYTQTIETNFSSLRTYYKFYSQTVIQIFRK